MKLFLVIALFAINTSSAFAQFSNSYASCAAYTNCLGVNAWGQTVVIGRISCQTYGSSYVYGSGDTSSACNWYVRPYDYVECNGFTKVFNRYTGQYAWAWNTFSYSCPR